MMVRYSLGIVDDESTARNKSIENSMEYQSIYFVAVGSLFDNIWKVLIISGITLICEMIGLFRLTT